MLEESEESESNLNWNIYTGKYASNKVYVWIQALHKCWAHFKISSPNGISPEVPGLNGALVFYIYIDEHTGEGTSFYLIDIGLLELKLASGK